MFNRKHLAFPLIFAAGLVAGGGTLAALGMAQDRDAAPEEIVRDREIEDLMDERAAVGRELREVERTNGRNDRQNQVLRDRMRELDQLIQALTHDRERMREDRIREMERQRAETRERFLPGPVDVWFTAEAGPVSRPNEFRGVTYVDTLSVGGTPFAAFERDGQMRLVSPAAIAALTPASRDEAGEAMDAAEDAMEEMGDQMNEAVEAAE